MGALHPGSLNTLRQKQNGWQLAGIFKNVFSRKHLYLNLSFVEVIQTGALDNKSMLVLMAPKDYKPLPNVGPPLWHNMISLSLNELRFVIKWCHRASLGHSGLIPLLNYSVYHCTCLYLTLACRLGAIVESTLLVLFRFYQITAFHLKIGYPSIETFMTTQPSN